MNVDLVGIWNDVKDVCWLEIPVISMHSYLWVDTPCIYVMAVFLQWRVFGRGKIGLEVPFVCLFTFWTSHCADGQVKSLALDK